MIRLSQGISECHVDEETSRAAGLSELGEDIVRHGNSGHVMDVSLGSKCVATMADASGHSQTLPLEEYRNDDTNKNYSDMPLSYLSLEA